MNNIQAIEALLKGHKIRQKDWWDDDMFLVLKKGHVYDGTGDLVRNPLIGFSDGEEDWEIYQEAEHWFGSEIKPKQEDYPLKLVFPQLQNTIRFALNETEYLQYSPRHVWRSV